MSPKELCVGDLVTFKDCQNDEKPTVIKIWQLNGDGHALAFIDGDKALDEIAIDDEIVGIPLTSEILKKNGFGYVESDSELSHYYPGEPYYCADMDFHIGTDRKGNFWLNYDNNSIFRLKYVHKLQHAFRILGINKEIVI